MIRAVRERQSFRPAAQTHPPVGRTPCSVPSTHRAVMHRLRLFPLLLALLIGACASAERTHPTTSTSPSAALRTESVPPADAASLDLDAPLPVDAAVRVGRLENGLTYYIRHNAEPDNRAELRLAVNAGSVLEDDDQRGLAHFLEHMLFNGTRRFEKQELVNFLERTGMRFGPDVNAYTSFDETVYMLTIPTDSTDIVEKAFDVLEDWAAYATLDPEEIEKERGVIIEEWRLRDQNASGRIREKTLPALLHGSRYRERLPIGDTTVIRHAPPAAFQRFYRTWYRPDLMAVVVVGDLDVDRAEALIRTHFSTLPAPAEAPARPHFDVPGHEKTLYAIVTDPEYPYSTVQVVYKQPADTLATVRDYRRMLVGQFFNDMLNNRLAEIARRPDAPFLGAAVSRGAIARPAAFYSIGAQVQDGGILTGLEALLTEVERVRRHGFTATELARQQQEIVRAYQRAYNERNTTNSAAYAREYVAHYLEREPIPGIAYEFDLVRRYASTITLDELNARAADLLAERNRVVTVVMPEKPDLPPPSEADLAGVFQTVDARAIDPYEDAVSDQPLVAEVPPPAPVVERREIPEVGVTEVRLANGIRLVLKPTDFKEDEVRFTAFSPGGSSLVGDEAYLEADFAPTIITQSGVGPFDRTQLEKHLAGKVVSVAPYIGELEEGFNGGGSPEDLETLFQLIYLYVTQPRADSSALAVFQQQIGAYLANRSATPSAALEDTLNAALYGNHLRRRVPTLSEIQAFDLREAEAVYRDRFADLSDFTFVFVGAFDVDRLIQLAQSYLGSLPASGRQETWRDVVPDLPDGVIQKTVRKGLADRSQVLLYFHGPFVYDRLHRHRLRSLAEVLNIRLREELREERGGVYGVSVRPSTSDRPDSTYSLTISFTTDPDRVDELAQAVFEQIDRLKTEGPTPDDVAKVKEQQRRERETQRETNGFWLSVLDFYYSHENEDLLDVLRYEELIASLTSEDIRQAARTYLDTTRYVRAVLLPDAAPASTEN
ncbi:MAG: insulinase family protein [Bacteroidetes bacterium]|nr:MAG: insulinase family protein [Bacteroidota bacterium]